MKHRKYTKELLEKVAKIALQLDKCLNISL